MNNKSIKRFIACLLILTGIASMLTAYASSMFDHQGNLTVIAEAVLQGPHPIPKSDPMYSPTYASNCHRLLYTRIFTCDCHGQASDIVTKYAPHSPGWTYSSAERLDIGRCQCGQTFKRNHQHVLRKIGEYTVNAYHSIIILRCVGCGIQRTQHVYH